MKNHFTKETFVIVIFIFQVQPKKAIERPFYFLLFVLDSLKNAEDSKVGKN